VHLRPLAAGALALGLLAPPAAAGDFDYYVLALSWSPTWCLTEGGPDDAQCDPARDLGFTLHGLWPQYEDGWPEYCETDAADPTRGETAAMADVMGSGGLARHQWRKHGRCTGLSARSYFDRARRAFAALDLPAPDRPRATAAEVEAAILAANPGLSEGGLVVTCGAGRIEEVRVCLTRDLEPRGCAADVARAACRTRGALDVPPVR
jgi:ribonuclease T2